MSKQGFKLNVGFITGVFAVCAVSIATGYFLKNGSISADTAATANTEYSNAEPVVATSGRLSASSGPNQTCASSTSSASATLAPLTDPEKEKYGETAKAYSVKINGKTSEFRLVMSASRVNDANDYTPNDGAQTDVMVEYTLTWLGTSKIPTLGAWGGNSDNITLIYNNIGYKKTYNTIVKNDPWEDFIKIKDGYSVFERSQTPAAFNVSIHFKGKNNDGCVANLDLKESLLASVAPTPSVTPSGTVSPTTSVTAGSSGTPVAGAPAVTLTEAVSNPASPQSVTLTTNASDANTAVVGTNFTYWWNCTASIAQNSSYDTIKGLCGEPLLHGDKSTPAKTATGWKFNNIFGTKDASGAKTLRVSHSITKNGYPTGPVTAIVLVERRGFAVNQKLQFTVAGGTGTVTPTSSATATSSVSPTSSVTPAVGYDYAGDEALNMSLKVEPIEGKLPLTVNATASLGGTATGYTYWRMYCGNALPNVNDGVVKPTKEVKDLNTAQTLSCTYKTKKSFRLFVIAERGGKKVVTKVWVKAGHVPLNANQETISIDLKKGFNVFGSELSSTALKFQQAGQLTVFRFNFSSYKKWLRWPEQNVNYNLQPGKGYYLYSPKDQKINVVMRNDGRSIDARKLFPGWNMIWTKDSRDGLKGVLATLSFSDSKDPLNKGTDKCVLENQDLQELVDKGVAYKYVYIIDNGNATDTCATFKLLETGSVQSDCAKINAAKTVTTSSTCSACSLGITDQLPAGSVFWVYIYDSKLRQVNGLTTASTAIATASPASKISLSGQMCK